MALTFPNHIYSLFYSIFEKTNQSDQRDQQTDQSDQLEQIDQTTIVLNTVKDYKHISRYKNAVFLYHFSVIDHYESTGQPIPASHFYPNPDSSLSV